MENKDKLIDELAQAIFVNCHVGLSEDEAKMVAKFVVEEIERREVKATRTVLSNLRDLWHEHKGHIPYYRLMEFERAHGG